MNESYLPQHATLDETCEWLRNTTGQSWTLPRLLESGLMPWFWLDYTNGWPAIFGNRVEGYLAPVLFAGDTQRLAADRQNLLVNMTRTHDGKIIKIGPPALSAPVAEIRFVRADIEQLAKDICAQPSQAASAESGKQAAPKGITKDQALIAFESLVKINLKSAMEDKPKWIKDACLDKGAPGKKHPSLWDPVILGIAIREQCNVPKSKLTHAFLDHPFLQDWRNDWSEKSDY